MSIAESLIALGCFESGSVSVSTRFLFNASGVWPSYAGFNYALNSICPLLYLSCKAMSSKSCCLSLAAKSWAFTIS